jgi:hypothetical protein
MELTEEEIVMNTDFYCEPCALVFPSRDLPKNCPQCNYKYITEIYKAYLETSSSYEYATYSMANLLLTRSVQNTKLWKLILCYLDQGRTSIIKNGTKKKIDKEFENYWCKEYKWKEIDVGPYSDKYLLSTIT